MRIITRSWFQDMAERVAWTAVQAGVGVVAVEVGNLEYGWAPVIAAGLAYIKAEVAKKIGDSQSASTLKGQKTTLQ